MISLVPVYIIDIIGSSLTIVLSFLAFGVMRRIQKTQRGFGLYVYLYLQTIALCVFAVSRSAGHIVKHILLALEYPHVWKMLAPISGSINSFTFIIFGLAALMYSNIKSTSDEMNALELSRRELKKAKNSIEKSLGEKHILLKEVHHRVKNNMAVITSLLDMQMMIVKDNECKQVLRECRQRIKSIALVHEKLYKAQDFLEIGVKDYIDSLIKDMMESYAISNVKPEFNIGNVNLQLNQLIPLGLILNEIVSNCLKHAFTDVDDPKLSISMSEKDNLVTLVIADNGPGMPQDAELKKSETLGVHIIDALVGQLDGEMKTTFGNGLVYSITFNLPGETD